MCKIDIHGAQEKYRKYLKFKWKGTLYEFGLGPAPLIFTK